MLSELEIARRKRLLDDLVDVELAESESDDFVCPDCGCIFFKLNFELGIVCADSDCKAVIDLSAMKPE